MQFNYESDFNFTNNKKWKSHLENVKSFDIDVSDNEIY